MMDREQQLLDTAIRYQALLDQGQPVNVRAFVANEPANLREELAEYLEQILVAEEPQQPIILTTEEQAMIDRIALRTWAKFQQRFAAAAPAQTLTALRQARKLSLRDVATHLNLPIDLLHRIERGGVRAATIPSTLISRFATLLGQAEATIQAALAQPPIAAATRLSAQGATEIKAEEVVDFADALRVSTATDAQKAEWA